MEIVVDKNINNEILGIILNFALEEDVSVSLIQRRLSIGYIVAKEHINCLLDNNFITQIGEYNYRATFKQYERFKRIKFVY